MEPEGGGLWLGSIVVVPYMLSACDEVCLFLILDVVLGSLHDSCFYFVGVCSGHHPIVGATSFWKHWKRC
jgi:hypothetical protein